MILSFGKSEVCLNSNKSYVLVAHDSIFYRWLKGIKIEGRNQAMETTTTKDEQG